MYKKKIWKLLTAVMTSALFFTACSEQEQEAADTAVTESTVTEEQPGGAEPEDVSTEESETADTAKEAKEPALADGIYSAKFDTDSSMIHVNEVYEGRGMLTVSGGEMTIHVVMPSKNVVNFYPGLMEDAQKEGAELIEPQTESVTYSDGMTEEVYAFDIPVPYLDESFDLALIGTKGKWYDHKVSVSDPIALNDETDAAKETYEDGTYSINISLTGGSGKAYVVSPAELTVSDGKKTLRVEWSSPNYDYMIVAGVKYEPVNKEGNSVFEIPVETLDKPLNLTADTTAMSVPHEIEYTISFEQDAAE